MIKIINEPNLPYKIIGYIIDKDIENNYDDTIYIGKIEYFEFIYKNKRYKCQIRYIKTGVEWRFMNYDN